MPFQIVRNNIVNMPVDAIVNAANSGLLMGGGVCGAIFNAAGAIRMQAACIPLAPCPTGSAVITPGFKLRAKHVIHAVGPVWHGGKRNEEALLRSAYTRSLELAVENALHSIAFPLISSGIYGYPKDQALKVALSAIQNFLLTHDDLDVYLVVFDSKAFTLSSKLSANVQSYIDEHYVRAVEASDSRRMRQHEEFEAFSAPRPCSAPAPARSNDLYFERAVRSLDELLSHRHEETFSEMLLRLVDEKGFAKDSIVYKRANIERSVFSKLRSNKDYTPSKSTAVALCIALELNMDQTRDLLSRAGYALSPSSLSDVIISYFIENSQYDIFEINAVLFQYDQTPLGAKG